MIVGVVPPTPAIARAITTTVAALAAAGHTVCEIKAFPISADPFTGLSLASQLINSDGCVTFNSHLHSFEPSDPGANMLTRITKLPFILRYLYSLYLRYIKGDRKWDVLIYNFGLKSVADQWKLVAQRELFREAWHQWWDEADQRYDFILCPVNASPALPHRAMHDAVSSCGYTFLWNLLDYTAGVLPVGHVDAVKDMLDAPYKTVLRRMGCDNAIARGAWMHYNSRKMAGLPTAVQVVGRRLQEEKVLGYMEVVEYALEKYADGGKYVLSEVD